MPESVNALEQYYRDLGPATANHNFLAQGRRANVAQRSMPGPTMQAANTQLAKEFRSMGDRGAIPDLINRGLIANTAGLPVDLVNTVLQSLGLGAEQPVGGSDSIRRALEYYGLSSDTQRPMLETLTGLTPPRAVMGAARAAGQGAEAVGRAAAPVAGQAIENYLVRSGGVLPMDTWHGSPHRFPPTAKNPLGEFDPMKIGTGEGAQVYGRGHYLAEAKKVADEYAGKLSKKMVSIEGFGNKDAERLILDRLSSRVNATQYGSGSQAALDDLISISRHGNQEEKIVANAMLNKIGPFGMPVVKDSGSLYKVDLPDEQIAKMLDWDKPLSQQAPEVQALIKKAHELRAKQTGAQFTLDMNAKGGDWLPTIGEGRLKEVGIPGIRYLDQGSRAGGAGTSNFVVFDPKHMNIIGRE